MGMFLTFIQAQANPLGFPFPSPSIPTPSFLATLKTLCYNWASRGSTFTSITPLLEMPRQGQGCF